MTALLDVRGGYHSVITPEYAAGERPSCHAGETSQPPDRAASNASARVKITGMAEGISLLLGAIS